MTLSIEDLYDKVADMAGNVEDNFLELGKALRQLQDRDPDLFRKLVVNGTLGRRKAYYLVEVSRTFDSLPVPRARLRAIGWTKLQLIGKTINTANMEDLLTLAEENNAKELERHMKGEAPLGNAHCVLMYFSPKQFSEVESALLANGGTRTGRGILNKEKALLQVIRKYKASSKAKEVA